MSGVTPVTIGIVGCGNISDAYFAGAAHSAFVRVKACADIRSEAAQSKAAVHGVQALSVEALLADPDIEIVVNLSVPQAHAPLGRQVIEAGKHLYLEKPLATDFAAARALLELARGRGIAVGCAPDTFIGASHQACRAAIDAGRIGRPIGGAVAVLSRGMERWHPNPDFFFKPGGGPILDLGPYYVTQLVNLLGPVARVTACATTGLPTRTIGSGPQRGRTIDVEVPTTVNGVLEFVDGANVALSASWDVRAHQRVPIEIYGTEGTLIGDDPNFFGGTPQLAERDCTWRTLDISAFPFGTDNTVNRAGLQVANYRSVGIVDMAVALRHGRSLRASGDLALHVLEVLEAFQHASTTGRHVTIKTRVTRPQPVPRGSGEEVFLAG